MILCHQGQQGPSPHHPINRFIAKFTKLNILRGEGGGGRAATGQLTLIAAPLASPELMGNYF